MASTLMFAHLHNAGISSGLREGSTVGSRRWPYRSCHPSCWQPPHLGVILAQNDLRAWHNTIAFGSAHPSQRDVDLHVEQLHARGLLTDRAPVLWSFPDAPTVYWSNITVLRPAEDDYRDWLRERSMAFARCETPRLAAA
jgi:hypothetical protein